MIVSREQILADIARTAARPAKRTPARVTAQPLKPCGTRAAYSRHIRRGETPCEPCYTARRAADKPAQCGTPGGHRRHAYLHEKPCRPCVDAWLTDREAKRAPCGTVRGYGAHKWRGEHQCPRCLAAYAQWQRDRRAQRKAGGRP